MNLMLVLIYLNNIHDFIFRLCVINETENYVCNIYFIILCSFISADKSVGAQGFRAVWTEVSEGPNCEQFTCAKSSYCISTKLLCNRLGNCGADDQSDEMNCE